MSNTIELAASNGKITGVTVMHLRAEILKSYKFEVKKGQNKAHIQWLPWRIVRDSLRVEGKGKATIQDVKLLDNSTDGKEISPALEALQTKRDHLDKSIQRCKSSIESLQNYLGSLNTQHTNATDLISVLENYEKAAAEQDKRLIDLEGQRKELDKEIKEEKQRIAPSSPEKRGLQAYVGLVAEEDTEVELVLKYAVSQANWNAAYDIRVDTSAEDKNVKVIYKANIFQKTGESWDDVPLTLETITPTFGVALPTLHQWNVSIVPPPPRKGTPTLPPLAFRRLSESIEAGTAGSDEDMAYGLLEDEHPDLEPPPPAAVSKGGQSATFRIPGTVTIPSGDGELLFTIAEMELGAVMNWFGIPKVDSGIHLKARIQNTSEYILVPGDANVYVDGSFISTTSIPLVSPFEHFDCALGVDPSVKTTYHPVQKTITTSGFYNRTTNTSFTQRITIENTRLTSIPLLKIVDQIPVSDTTQVAVRLLSPPLTATVPANPRASILMLPTPSQPGTPNPQVTPSQPNTPLPTPSLTSASQLTPGGEPADPTASPSGFTTISLKEDKLDKGKGRAVELDSQSDGARGSTETPPPPATENASLIRTELNGSAGPNVQVAETVWALWHGANEKNVEVEALGKDGKVSWLCELPAQEVLHLVLKWEVSKPAKFDLEFSRRAH